MEKLKTFSTFLFWCAILLGVIWLANSCSPDYHLNKYKKKGGKITCDVDTVKIYDTIVTPNDTIVISRDSLIIRTNTNVITKYEVKYDYKRFRDSLKAVKAMYKDSVKTVVKEKRIEGKTIVRTERAKGKWWLWLLIGIVVGYILQPILTILGAFKNLPINR
jgi:hypothetical protein